MSSKKKPGNPIKIEIDSKSGFCFGVARAVMMAENELLNNESLYVLGDIVHNNEEILRLKKKGIKLISHQSLKSIKNGTVLFRAHGEPPLTYKLLKEKGSCIIDATCPVVLKLQERVRKSWLEMKKINGKIAIYGKEGHPEVTGLTGQTNQEAIIINSIDDIKLLDFGKPLELFSQTTMSYKGFEEIRLAILAKSDKNTHLKFHNTICAQVGNRAPHLKKFAVKFDVVIFVGGENSSNAKVLYNICKENNPNSYFVTSELTIDPTWFKTNVKSIGICGATSTPQWLMEKVANSITRITINNQSE